MSDIGEDAFPLEASICKSCVHRFSRLLIPLDYESYGINIEDFDNMDDEDEIIVEQHICLISQQDLDGAVKECNKFKSVEEGSFFSGNPYY